MLAVLIGGLGAFACGSRGAPDEAGEPGGAAPPSGQEAGRVAEKPGEAPTGDADLREPEPLRVLIFSGLNNHDWKRTTPALKKIYEDSGRFLVDVTDEPAAVLKRAATFAEYDVLVSNWSAWPKVNERAWGPATEDAFLDFVRGGKGFALFHAASATFRLWPEYQELIGATWGESTGHATYHTFKVTIADTGHPVTRGMVDFWTADELWHRMKTQPLPATRMRVLCKAFSAKDKGGTGEAEPVVICTRFGKGRCFNLVLGHDVRAMRNAGWRTLMLRGTEWAATGRVTIPVPDDWPSRRVAAEVLTIDVDAALKAVATYKHGQGRSPLRAVEKLVGYAATTPAFREKLAPRLAIMLSAVQTGGPTTDGKKFICKQLSLIGSAEEVPALAGLLGDEDLSFAARSALERIPGEEALQACRVALKACRTALEGATGPALVGLMNTLGERRDARAVDAIARHLSSGDAVVVGAAIDALGKIGGPGAARALSDAVAKLPRAILADALLRCAEGLLSAGATHEAAAIYEDLSRVRPARDTTKSWPRHVRVAAFPGLVACRKEKAAELLLGALTGEDREMQLAAVRCVRSRKGAGGGTFDKLSAAVLSTSKGGGRELTEAIGGMLPRFPLATRVQIIAALADRGDPAALPALSAEASSEDQAVRRAALAALGRLGDASSVALLAGRASKASGSEKRIARKSLVRLRGEGVDAEMIRLLGESEAAVRRELIVALCGRRSAEAVPALLTLLEAARDQDRSVRREAVRALGVLADVTRAGTIADLLGRVGSASDARDIENALVAVCRRAGPLSPRRDQGVRRLLRALRGAQVPTRCSLLRVLGKLGGEKALSAVRATLKDDNAEVRTAAVRALADWPSPEPLADLLKVARSPAPSAAGGSQRILALRGFARLSSGAKDRPAEEMAKLYTEAMALAARAEEKKILLSGLGHVRSPVAMRLAARFLADPALANEAGLAVVEIADALSRSHRAEVTSALDRVLAATGAPAVTAKAQAVLLKLDKPVNLALGAVATSPDGLDSDGAAGGDQAAIDGDPNTYWDEVDGKKLYRLKVTFERPTEVSGLSITGYQHHNYAPKDFDILCDDEVVKAVRDAVYDDNRLSVVFPVVRTRSLELKIAGYYGRSPAVRELEIYHSDPSGRARVSEPAFPTEPSYSWRQADTSLALLNHGRVVWRLNFDRREGKPYLHPLGLIDPSRASGSFSTSNDGTELTWLRPPDHPWHRALWFSWKYINGLNYWEEDRRTGLSQGRTELVDVKVAPVSSGKRDHSARRSRDHPSRASGSFSTSNDDVVPTARIEMTLSYHPPGKPAVLTERRLITVSAPDEGGGYSVDWQAVFTAGKADVLLDRTPIPGQKGGVGHGGYAGLSLRMAKSTRGWHFIDSTLVQSDPAGTRSPHGRKARWMAFSGRTPSGREAGIAVLDHPDNLRHPSPWYVAKGMPYFGAAVLFKKPYTLAAGESLKLRYRILIHPGRADRELVEKEWRAFRMLKQWSGQ